MQVLGDDKRFSVSGYGPRMDESIGRIFLARDDGDEYRRESAAANRAIMAIREPEAFARAFDVAEAILRRAITPNLPPAPLPLEPVVATVVALVSKALVGIPDGHFFQEGGKPLDAGTSVLHCPHHTVAPSRYVFSSPLPRDPVVELGKGHGKALLAKMVEFVESIRLRLQQAEAMGGPSRKPPLPRLLEELLAVGGTDEQVARNLLGVLEGMHPTVHGNAVQVLNQWLGNETFWRVQQDYLATDIQRPVTIGRWRPFARRSCVRCRGALFLISSTGRPSPPRTLAVSRCPRMKLLSSRSPA